MKLPNPTDLDLTDEKSRVAALSILSNTLLVTLKLGVGAMIGSVSVMSEAIHSGLDLVAAAIAFFSVRSSSRPPDKAHRYGHGKFENISGTIEAMLIFIAAVWIIIGACQKIIHGVEIETVGPGIAVMGFSALVNLFVSRAIMRTARKADSIALEADALHLRTDVYTSVGVFLGLAVLQVTKLQILDPIIAIAVALLILKAAYQLTLKACAPLLDVALPGEEESVILSVLEKLYQDGVIVEFHDLRTRKAGADRHIDIHLVVPRDLPILEVHQLCDQIEEDIKNRLGATHILIHAEPCKDEHCMKCLVRYKLGVSP